MSNNIGSGMKNLTVTQDIVAAKELTLLEKLVLAYQKQVEPFEGPGDSCAIFLDISEGDVFRAKAHLSDLGYTSDSSDKALDEEFLVIPRKILAQDDLTPVDRLVLARIASFDTYNETPDKCAKFLGVAKPTVVRVKQRLLKKGLLECIDDTGRSKILRVVKDIEIRQVPQQKTELRGNQAILRPSTKKTQTKSDWSQWKKRYAKYVPILDEATNYLARHKIPLTDPKAFRRSLLAVVNLYDNPDDDQAQYYLIHTYIEYLESDEYLYQLEHTKYCPSISTQADFFGKFQAIREFKHDNRRHYDPTKTLTR